MRSSTRRALTLSAFAASALVWSGCEAKKQTEYVAGISTQVVVPRDLKAIVVTVSVGGVPQFCRPYRVYDGRVQLPRSLGQFPSAGKPGPDPITVTVVGFTEELNETSANPVFNDCVFNAARVNKDNARVLRRSRQPYVADEILFLPMPLKFSCFDKDCGEGDDRTCKAGRCETATTDETLLPRFTEDLIDGTGSACFPASECFAVSVPPVVVDPNDCTYALPNTPSAPPLAPGAPANPLTAGGEGINVEVTYDGGYSREILDKEPQEGFLVPDPLMPQRFRLAPGLCDMVKGVDPEGNPTPHRITAVRAAGVCRAKGPFQPLCAADQLAAMGTPDGISSNPGPSAACVPTQLKPAKSVLMILADDTENNAIFYTGGGGSGTGSAELAKSDLVSAALSDPAFSNTSIGLSFFPGSAGAACTPHALDVPPVLAKDARQQIITKFGALKAPGALEPKDTPLNMRGALDDAYALLRTQFADANRRAVLLVGNRSFDVNACGGTPADRAAAARTTDKIETYVALFARDAFAPDTDPPPVLPGAFEVAQAGSNLPPGTARAFDARKDKTEASNVLRRIVDDLATCAYDVPADPGNDTVLSYSDPTAVPGPQKAFYSIAHDPACTSEGTAGNGWSYNPTTKRIHVCGEACTGYRSVLTTAAAYAAQYGQVSAAVPLFAHKSACAPK